MILANNLSRTGFCLSWYFRFKVCLSVQLLSRVRLFVTAWTAACQASLSITNSRSLPKLMSIESVMPFNHLILCHPLLLLPSVFPSIRIFSNKSAFCISWPKYWSFSFSNSLPMNIQGWFPLGLTVLISLQSKELSRLFQHHNLKDGGGAKGLTGKIWNRHLGKWKNKWLWKRSVIGLYYSLWLWI